MERVYLQGNTVMKETAVGSVPYDDNPPALFAKDLENVTSPDDKPCDKCGHVQCICHVDDDPLDDEQQESFDESFHNETPVITNSFISMANGTPQNILDYSQDTQAINDTVYNEETMAMVLELPSSQPSLMKQIIAIRNLISRNDPVSAAEKILELDIENIPEDYRDMINDLSLKVTDELESDNTAEAKNLMYSVHNIVAPTISAPVMAAPAPSGGGI